MVKFELITVLSFLTTAIAISVDADGVIGLAARSLTNPKHCGSKNLHCPAPAHGVATCVDGKCGFTCNKHYAKYEGHCYDLSKDPNHCGRVTHKCPVPQHGSATCSDGKCGIKCDEYHSLYHGYCKNTGSDPDNCGSIGHKCRVPSNGHAVCSHGKCGILCNKGYHHDIDYDYCVKNGPTKSHEPHAKRAFDDQVMQEAWQMMYQPTFFQEARCKNGEKACHLLKADGTSSTVFECVNTMTDVFSCGSCQTPERNEDCTRLPNVDSVYCDMGQCNIQACKPGFQRVNSTACVSL